MSLIGLFGQNYRVATLSTFYLKVSGKCLKLIGQFYHAQINEKSYPLRKDLIIEKLRLFKEAYKKN